MMRNVKAGTLTYWLTVLSGYYCTVILKMLTWTHHHGGFAAHDMRTLITVTLRTTTVDAGILLAFIFALNRYMALRQRDATTVQTAKVAQTYSEKRRASNSM